MQSMQHFILHDGPEEHGIALLNATGRFAHELHDEIWVFDLGMWQKDRNLWQEIQKADWKDVILKDGQAPKLQLDILWSLTRFRFQESVEKGRIWLL
jgi:transitional endoplasmic reticulum ATPase